VVPAPACGWQQGHKPLQQQTGCRRFEAAAPGPVSRQAPPISPASQQQKNRHAGLGAGPGCCPPADQVVPNSPSALGKAEAYPGHQAAAPSAAGAGTAPLFIGTELRPPLAGRDRFCSRPPVPPRQSAEAHHAELSTRWRAGLEHEAKQTPRFQQHPDRPLAPSSSTRRTPAPWRQHNGPAGPNRPGCGANRPALHPGGRQAPRAERPQNASVALAETEGGESAGRTNSSGSGPRQRIQARRWNAA